MEHEKGRSRGRSRGEQSGTRFASRYEGARDKSASRRSAASGEPSRAGWIELEGDREAAAPLRAKRAPGLGGSGSGGNSSGRRGKKEESSQQKAKKKLRMRIIAIIVAEVFALCFIFASRYVVGKMNLIGQNVGFNMEDMTNPNLSHEKLETMKGYWTVALFGVDSRGDNVARQTNSDVIIIANVNMDTGEIKLVSVYRDSYLNIDEGNSYNKINQAYFLGGAEQAISALNRNLDLQIDDYGTFNWKTVAQVINALGGVDVNLSKAEFYYINAYITETVKATGIGSTQLTHAGENHLDGIQAVAYARLRNMDTDFARTERQREVIAQSFEKLKKSDFATINYVMETVLKGIETNISYDDLLPAAMNLTKYHISETTGFPTARDNVNMGRKGACVIPATLESNVKILHEFLFGEEDYEPSDKVKQISAKISADSGSYKEAKPIDHVGTDGGYIPTTGETEESQTLEGETLEGETLDPDETTGTDETTGLFPGLGNDWIDGEYPEGLELETDEDGNYIDPPEGWGPGYEFTRPAPTRETGESGRHPESTTVAHPADSSTQSQDELTGPGVPTRPAQTTGASRPGSTVQPSSPGASSPHTSEAQTTEGTTVPVQPSPQPETVPDNSAGGPDSVILNP